MTAARGVASRESGRGGGFQPGRALGGRAGRGTGAAARGDAALGGPGTGGHPLGLRVERMAAVVGEPVVAPQPALLHLLPVQHDQAVGGEPVQHAVQRADPQLHLPSDSSSTSRRMP
ncbi:hypothetical protein ADL02_24660 [Streptomyces sp. NRRL WC-3723]|nr:hypothetical protein ADL02_24660 [Streptomyces sp. NRRL WC-3723]